MTDRETAELNNLDTWPRLLEYNHSRYGGGSKAMRYKHYGIWQSYTWQDYYQNVKYLALGLQSLGFQAGNKLLIIGDNAPEWYFGELAAQCNKGISVGQYSDLSTAELLYIAQDSEAEFALVEDQEQVDKLEQIIDKLPKLKKVIYWVYKGLTKQKSEAFKGYRDVLKMGREYEKTHPGIFEKNVAEGRAEDICAIIYTSGTTGDGPKGAQHTYKSLRYTSDLFYKAEKLTPKDNLVSYLPPAWITEQWLAFGCHLLSGGTVNFAESAETQEQDIREIGPTMVIYNSRLWERQAGKVQARIQGANVLKKLVFRRFMPVGFKIADLKYQKKKADFKTRMLYFIAYWLLFRPLRDGLGLPHSRVCYTAGSILSAETLRFYHALNIPLKNIYGSTEAGAMTGAANEDNRLNSAGKVNNGIEIKTTSDGEIITRNPGIFAGYYNNPGLTAQVFIDGWVHSGDCGSLTDDGQLIFIDRMTDLVRRSDGKTISTQALESRLKQSPYIKDAWVSGGQDCEYMSAIIIVDAENTGRWADKHKVTYTTFGDLSQKTEVYRLIENEIACINADLPHEGRIRKYVNLHKEFDPDELELTRTRKLRKGWLRQKYADLIMALSGNKECIVVEAQFTYQDGRAGNIRTELKIKTVGEAAG
jgi:long-chain acyl-CoA synthetase